MISLILGLVCALVALSFLSLLKTYQHIPAREVKRMARAGDTTASVLYRPIAYGASLPLVLWVVVGVTAALSLLLFANALPFWLALLVAVVVIWGGFAWIPTSDLSNFGVFMAKKVAGPLAWLLERINPISSRIANFIRSHRPIVVHTGLYQKSDLVELLQLQKDQPDSRIATGEIDMLSHALSFGDKLVSDILIPKRVVDEVSADEAIGPILTDELHKSGHSRFPVYEGKKDNIVGILYLRDLILNKKTGTVRSVMKGHLTYVHEDFTLYQTLEAFIKTKQHLFLVVNKFEEFVGIITIEDVIEQMVGKVIVDEFDNYDDLRAVATKAAKKDHVKHVEVEEIEPETESEPTPEDKEVVE
jgi:CBS domain containing-hemolysin-like protein